MSRPKKTHWGDTPLYTQLKWKAQGVDAVVSSLGHRVVFILAHKRDAFLRDVRAARKIAREAEE